MTIAVNYLWVNKGCLFAPGETERHSVKEPQDHREREEGERRKAFLLLGAPGKEKKPVWPSRRPKGIQAKVWG